MAAGAAVQHEVGEGSGHVADCRSRAGIGRCTGRGRAGGPRRSSVVPTLGVMTQASLYEQVGGLPFFERLVDRFYDGVEADDVLLPLYPDQSDLVGARRRLALFLVQYWGGPTTYLRGARPPAAPGAALPVLDRRARARPLARPHARCHRRVRRAR